MCEVHQAEELLVAAMEGEVQLLKEMKTIKQRVSVANSELPDSVGGADVEEQLGEMFTEHCSGIHMRSIIILPPQVLKWGR